METNFALKCSLSVEFFLNWGLHHKEKFCSFSLRVALTEKEGKYFHVRVVVLDGIAIPLSPSPAEPGYTLLLQTV